MTDIKVLPGLSRLDEAEKLLAGRRLGLLTTPAAVDHTFTDAITVLGRRFTLTALFSPEHGVRGDQQAGVDIPTCTDSVTGLPVYSLYHGDQQGMTPEMTETFDLLVVDVQDVGCRFYTYLAALMSCMTACAAAGKPLLVLDRPNPAGCETVEGTLPQPGHRSIVCAWEMPQRTGLTLGEFARMVNSKEKIGCELHVLPVAGLRRSHSWADTGCCYINASPNLPTIQSVLLYSGTCLLEGTCLSEGRGNTHPFEMVGAPWLNPMELAETMNSYGLPGVHFRPVWFSPTFSKHQGQVCGGVQIHLLDEKILRPVETGLLLLWAMEDRSPKEDFWIKGAHGGWFIDQLMGSSELRQSPDREALIRRTASEAAAFREASRPYWLYE